MQRCILAKLHDLTGHLGGSWYKVGHVTSYKWSCNPYNFKKRLEKSLKRVQLTLASLTSLHQMTHPFWFLSTLTEKSTRLFLMGLKTVPGR